MDQRLDSMRELKIYSTEDCVSCKRIKGMLDFQKVPYNDIMLTELTSSIRSVPTIHLVENNEVVEEFTGFSLPRINMAIRWLNN